MRCELERPSVQYAHGQAGYHEPERRQDHPISLSNPVLPPGPAGAAREPGPDRHESHSLPIRRFRAVGQEQLAFHLFFEAAQLYL